MSAKPTTARASRIWILQLAFLALHAPLALAIPRYSSLAMWHGRLALLAGLAFALSSRRPHRAAYAMAYIAGGEVFWRMRKADLPWEFGKYAIVLIAVVALVRAGRIRRSGLPFLYFGLLLPSVLISFQELSSAEVRDQLSFNLAGPLALALCAAFFSTVPLKPAEFRVTAIALLGPVVSIATLGVQSLRLADIQFYTASNAGASGGFGPNQVSGALGLGLVMVLCYFLVKPPNIWMTGAMVALTLLLVRQVILTFSRGGLYMALVAAAAAAFLLLRDSVNRWRMLAGGAGVAVLFLVLVLPRIEALTGGAAGERFGSLETTGRFELMKADLMTFSDNPVLGAGPGGGNKNRLKFFRVGTAHTEWTRLISEHGVLGLVAGAILIYMFVLNLRRAPTPREQAIVAALVAYSFVHMTVDATRLVAPSFAFGLSCMTLMRPRRAAQGAAAVPAPPSLRAAAGGRTR